MNQKLKSPEFLNKRRFFTFLPVIIVPFATLLFVLLGGGKGITNNGVPAAGINTELPDARNDMKKQLNKMSLYEKATADSNRLAQQSKTDPYHSSNATAVPETFDQEPLLLNRHHPEPSEQQIYQKLEQLNKVLNQPDKKFSDPVSKSNPVPMAENTHQLQQLRSMMTAMEEEKQADPELSQLQQLLEKIQEIQHPELLKEKPAPILSQGPKKTYPAIPAVITNDQKIQQGTVVALTLLDSAVLNGQHIPRGHQVYGSCQISNQRIRLHIKSIGLGYTIIPVDLLVYDLRDRMEGINAPEAVTTDALKEGSDRAIQSLQMTAGMDQHLSTQLAEAGINTAKGLFGKKIKRIKAKLKAGYQVLLKDNQSY